MLNSSETNESRNLSTQSYSSGFDSAPDNINFLNYLELIVTHKRLISRTTLTAFILSLILSLLLPNIYSSTALILPPQQNSGTMGMMLGQLPGGIAGLAGDLLGKTNSADLYARMLTSDAISDIIIDRFKLMDVYDQDTRIDTYKVLDKKVDISAGKKDGVVAIVVEDKDPKRAADMANAYVEEIDKLSLKLDTTDAGHDTKFLASRLAQAKVDLTKAEDAIKVFQSENKAIDIAEQAKGTLKGVGDLEGMLAIEEGKLAGIKSVFRDGSEEVKAEQAIIANLRQQISKFQGTRSADAVPGVASVPTLGQQFLRLTREFKIQEALVEFLTKQYEMSKLSEAKEVAGIQVIQRAQVPDKKIKPKRSLIVLGSSFAACFVSIVFVFVREACKRMPEEDRQRLKRIRTMLSLRAARK